MEAWYFDYIFRVCLVCTALVTYAVRSRKAASDGVDERAELADRPEPAATPRGAASRSAAAARFELTFLTAYLLLTAGDWLQGPYVYALYHAYGFSKRDIATLFVAGYASSLVFGFCVGHLADRYGRKRFGALCECTRLARAPRAGDAPPPSSLGARSVARPSHSRSRSRTEAHTTTLRRRVALHRGVLHEARQLVRLPALWKAARRRLDVATLDRV